MPVKLARILPVGLIVLGLSACGGGTRLIKNAPPPPQQVSALAAASDDALSAQLQWVIVRDGPGTWAQNADWDEYLIEVRNVSAAPIQVTGVVLFDSMDQPNSISASRTALVDASRKNAKRYKDSGLRVAAGRGRGLALVAGGAGATTLGMGAAYATLMGAGSGAAAAASGLILAGPAMVTMAIVRGVRKGAVTKRIKERSSVFPIALEAGQTQALDVFFPLAPAPRRIEIHYTDAKGTHMLSTDTSKALDGLHLEGQPQK